MQHCKSNARFPCPSDRIGQFKLAARRAFDRATGGKDPLVKTPTVHTQTPGFAKRSQFVLIRFFDDTTKLPVQTALNNRKAQQALLRHITLSQHTVPAKDRHTRPCKPA